jgi:hypothetical protein
VDGELNDPFDTDYGLCELPRYPPLSAALPARLWLDYPTRLVVPNTHARRPIRLITQPAQWSVEPVGTGASDHRTGWIRGSAGVHECRQEYVASPHEHFISSYALISGHRLYRWGIGQMTDIDLQSEISFNYHNDDLNVSFGLVGQVSRMWCERYQALARAKDVNAMVHAKPGGRPRLYVTVPTKTSGSDVQTMLDVARDLIAEADAVDQSPTSSDSPEAVVREWWNRQRTA